MRDTVAAVVFRNGDQLWGMRIQWRLLFSEIAISCGDEGYSGGCCFQKWRTAVGIKDTVAAVVFRNGD
jgi:hypothetical protein